MIAVGDMIQGALRLRFCAVMASPSHRETCRDAGCRRLRPGRQARRLSSAGSLDRATGRTEILRRAHARPRCANPGRWGGAPPASATAIGWTECGNLDSDVHNFRYAQPCTPLDRLRGELCLHGREQLRIGDGLRAVRPRPSGGQGETLLQVAETRPLVASDCDREHLIPDPLPPRVHDAPRAALANWRGRRPGSKGLKIPPAPARPNRIGIGGAVLPDILISHPAPEKISFSCGSDSPVYGT
jgi:hypothetical protein